MAQIEAEQALCEWIESHLGHFFPSGIAGSAAEWSIKIRPACELSIVLFGVTGPRPPANGTWARLVSEKCRELLLPADQALPGIIASGAAESHNFKAALLVFIAIERITGRRFRSHDIVRSVFAMPPRSNPGPDLDHAIATDLAGIRDYGPQMTRRLEALMRRYPSAPALGAAARPALYDVTHACFLATRFGHRTPPWPARHAAWLTHTLGPAAAARLQLGDLDVAAELTAAALWCGLPLNPHHQQVLNTLSRTALATGCIVPGAHFAPEADFFDRAYHPTLTALAALSAANRAQLS
ncbi:hypothetical protein GCM10010430_22910 [Kitasatospora cystarginea]|uniref:DUF6895 domain-containing protein n=1 Tax=Kitasatospora cystarginea TaxID=58350 RepID=A0ABN3DT73_9ACTN